jgi:hypothetical protein
VGFQIAPEVATKRFLASIGIVFAIPLAFLALPMAACRPSMLDGNLILMELLIALSAAVGFALAYPILRIGRDGTVQRRRYLAPLIVGFAVVALFFTMIIPITAHVLLGPLWPREGLPEFMSGWVGDYVLTAVASFLLTLVLKLWDVVAT